MNLQEQFLHLLLKVEENKPIKKYNRCVIHKKCAIVNSK